jgi:hypothetical protein
MTTVTSVISTFGEDKAAAAAYLQSSGLPMQLCLLTGHSCIEIGPDLFGQRKPFGLTVTDASLYDDGTYVLSFALTCISLHGKAVDYGSVDPKSVLPQKDANLGGKPQWFTLNAKVAFDSAPEGAEEIFDQLVKYHFEAKADSKSFAVRQKEHPVWVQGTVRFQLAAGGKYGLYISALDCSDAVFCGSGGAEPSEHAALDCVAVEDVSALFGGGAPKGAKSAPTTKVVGSGRRPK